MTNNADTCKTAQMGVSIMENTTQTNNADTKLEIRRSILNFKGGLLGRSMIAQCGFIDAFTINNKFSVLISKDHASVKAMDSEPVTEELCRQVAKQELGYKKFNIKQEGSCFYIYNEEHQND